MGKKSTFALCAISLACVVLWLSRGRDDPAPVLVQAPQPSTALHAQDAARTGPEATRQEAAGSVSEESSAVSLTPSAARTFEIEVVDDFEQPLVGVPVRIVGMYRVEYEQLWSGVTGEAGRVVVDIGAVLDYDAEGEIQEYVVGLSTALAVPSAVSFQRGAPPSGVLRFRSGPTCDLEVVLVDRTGQPMTCEAFVRLSVDAEAPDALPLPLRIGWIDLETRQGQVLLEGIGLDLALRVSAHSRPFDFATRTVRSPGREGERLRIELPLEHVFLRVVGRVLDSAGDGLGGADVHVTIERPDREPGHRWSRDGQTDGQGNFEIFAYPGGLEPAQSDVCTVVARVPDGRKFAGSGMVRRVAADAADFDRLVVELGDLWVAPQKPPPLLAAGRIVDSAGNAVPSAIAMIRPLAPTESTTWSYGGEPPDRDGRFEIRADIDWTRVAVRGQHSRLAFGEEVEADVGARDLILRVDPPGQVISRVLLPAGLTVGDLLLRVSKSEPGSVAQTPGSYESSEDGRFALPYLGAGFWNILLDFEGSLIATWNEVQVESGKTTLLEARDLRELRASLTLRAVDERGLPLPGADATHRRVDGGRGYASADADGLLTLATLQPFADVSVSAPDRRPVHIEQAVDGATFVLAPGIPCLARWPDGARPGPEAAGLRAWLDHVGEQPLERYEGYFEFELQGAGPYAARAPLAGRYRIELRAGVVRIGRAPVVSFPDSFVDIADDGTVQEFELPLDVTALEALREAGR